MPGNKILFFLSVLLIATSITVANHKTYTNSDSQIVQEKTEVQNNTVKNNEKRIKLNRENDKKQAQQARQTAQKAKEEQKKLTEFTICKDTLNAKNYDEALICFSELCKKYNNTEFRYYLGWLYGRNKNYQQALEQYQYILDKEKKNEKLISLANDEIKRIKLNINEVKQIKKQDVGNYFDDMDSYAQWKTPKHLYVYIDNSCNKKELFKKAFRQWYNLSYEMVEFYYTNDKDKANITATAISLKDLRAKKTENIDNSDDLIGITLSKSYYDSKKDKNFLDKADIFVSHDDDNGKERSDAEFISIALHEIGHSLGIQSHSKSRGDIMYPNNSSIANQESHLSHRDINTLRKIYKNSN